jgi:flagellar protein FlaI
LISKPMDVPEAFIPFLDLAITVRRFTLPVPGGGTRSVRRIVSIDEVYGAGNYNPIFTWDPSTDKLVVGRVEKSRKLAKLAKSLGITLEQVESEIQRRSVVLQWMHEKGYRNFKEITPLLQSYVEDPSGTYNRAESELSSIAPVVPKSGEVKS